MTLEDRFDRAIDEENFSVLELTGFSAVPRLALKAGMALGYGLAMTDLSSQLKRAGVVLKKGEGEG